MADLISKSFKVNSITERKLNALTERHPELSQSALLNQLINDRFNEELRPVKLVRNEELGKVAFVRYNSTEFLAVIPAEALDSVSEEEMFRYENGLLGEDDASILAALFMAASNLTEEQKDELFNMSSSDED
ncbi:hypothetical protein [uncultured Parasphingorhabdus sp.]|uniref:hypothetical protein n=1 Tax=uncultured Parasphingorhabdus sp. TaxID=2709694 RepID=UPI002AA642B4|nr:hypothetical protein [uncultured Parasphingorhabdus sp.]